MDTLAYTLQDQSDLPSLWGSCSNLFGLNASCGDAMLLPETDDLDEHVMVNAGTDMDNYAQVPGSAMTPQLKGPAHAAVVPSFYAEEQERSQLPLATAPTPQLWDTGYSKQQQTSSYEHEDEHDDEDEEECDDNDQVVPGANDSSPAFKRRRVGRGHVEQLDLMPEEFADLKGTTAMQARRMTPDEREIVLMKRKLRNRQSAKRSRVKRQLTLNELNEEYRDLVDSSAQMRQTIMDLINANKQLQAENARLRARN
ncbi:hypothetical protein FVE85_9267 [Porphyridium purpureum]|uniref:BZIP domain-containing protein n=1 Tax=Porphyridium purpureum TaxID=35688 RepID=A0A5J4YP72_PORPP|nr:hypothetical protein FVE85_9267 [Porphyridium purpureum]|eukprot:POR3270..scf222_8